MTSQTAEEYFDFLAKLGMTKHYGSMEATRELAELCRIGRGTKVLDVGCGVGATPSYLAKAEGSDVVALDLMESMIQQSRLRAMRQGVDDRVEFTVADAQRLPFADNLFDAVIMESVNVLFDDKPQAMSEYLRVTRPGGYVGMTEMTWLQPPTPELVDVFKRAAYATAMDADGWTELLKTAGLQEVIGNGYRMDIALESKGRAERYGYWGIAKAVLKMLVAFVTDRKYRGFLKDGTGAVDRSLLDTVGYGVYVGRKGESPAIDPLQES
jgi:ubiquinone/menaquinone biosynthesis C-methylase UbiE